MCTVAAINSISHRICICKSSTVYCNNIIIAFIFFTISAINLITECTFCYCYFITFCISIFCSTATKNHTCYCTTLDNHFITGSIALTIDSSAVNGSIYCAVLNSHFIIYSIAQLCISISGQYPTLQSICHCPAINNNMIITNIIITASTAISICNRTSYCYCIICNSRLIIPTAINFFPTIIFSNHNCRTSWILVAYIFIIFSPAFTAPGSATVSCIYGHQITNSQHRPGQ